MASRTVRSWHIRLGIVPVLVLTGFGVSSIILSFFSGYFFGHTVGFRIARESTVSTSPHMPVVNDMASAGEAGQTDDGTREFADIYAKLNEPATLADEAPIDEKPVKRAKSDVEPLDVQAIPSSSDVPVLVEEENGKKGVSLDRPDAGSNSRETLGGFIKGTLSDKRAPSGSDIALGAAGKEDASVARASMDSIKAEETKAAELVSAELKSAELKVAQKKAALEKEAREKEERATAEALKRKQAQLEKAALVEKAEKAEKAKLAAAKAKADAAKAAALQTARLEQQKSMPSTLRKDNKTSVGARVPSGWFAQVAAPRKPDDAQFLARQLRKSGFSALVETAHINGQEYYRVLVGPENSRDQASRLVKQLQREPYMQGEPFPRYVQ